MEKLRDESGKSMNQKMFLGMLGASILSLLFTFADKEPDKTGGFLVALMFLVLALYFKFRKPKKND